MYFTVNLQEIIKNRSFSAKVVYTSLLLMGYTAKVFLRFFHPYRLLLDKQGVLEKSEEISEIVLSWEFIIDFETAKTFRKSGGNYLRANQWEDLTVEVRVS